MKRKIVYLCIAMFSAAVFLTACGRGSAAERGNQAEMQVQSSQQQNETAAPETAVPESVVLNAYIQEIDGKILVLADRDGGLYQMDPEGVEITLADGSLSDVQQLEPGMAVDLVHSGVTMRNYPATIPQVQRIAVVTDSEDPYGFYRMLLQTIWDTSPELNEEIEFVALDLSDAENITKNQKYVLEYLMRNICGCEVQLTTENKLEREGTIVDEQDRFADGKGMLITIDDERRNGDRIIFDAEKWISDTQEIQWDDNVARYQDGEWTIVTTR